MQSLLRFWRFRLLRLLASTLLGGVLTAPVVAEELFEIRQIDVRGNTLLASDAIDRLLRPFVGRDKGFRDIQMALEALESAYRRAGYNAVQVITPEQELTGGTLRLVVQETPVGKVTISGNRHFSEENIRAALPGLREGSSPNARRLSENVQLANENPARQIDVVLGVSETTPGQLDATVKVEDEAPLRVFLNADNTGSESVGRHRTGIGLRHANLWNRDHIATFAYTTSPDAPQGTKVDIFSLGYRLPLFAIGDSIDLFYAKSSINAPASSFAVDSSLGLSGKGDLYGIRWNHYFARHGEWSTRLVGGWDIKAMKTTCTNSGAPIPPGTSASCTPYTTRPLSLTYSGTWQRPGAAADFSAGAAYNLPTGSRYDYTMTNGASGNDRYSLVSGSRATRDDFTVLKFSGSVSRSLPANWMARVAGSYQSSLGDPLPGSEQIGLAGAQAVRGFHERVVASDSGFVANIELYAPDVAPALALPGDLRPLLFLDAARGNNHKMAGSNGALVNEPYGIMGAGMGLRYSYRKDVQIRFDLASVLEAGPAQRITDSTSAHNGDWRGHVNVTLGF